MPEVSEPVQMYLPIAPALENIMQGDLSFKGTTPSHTGHNTHAFAAKFPPQLPHAFIRELTDPGEIVLDPMAGSGTAIIEAARTGRAGIGVDFDPLAVQICEAKISRFEAAHAEELASKIISTAEALIESAGPGYTADILAGFDPATREFLAYWFLPETIAQLGALRAGIAGHATGSFRVLFDTLFSSIIVTKSGGVSLARDLAHTRPHKVADKNVRSAIRAFREKCARSIPSLGDVASFPGTAQIARADSKNLPLRSGSVQLIVTSPPYANAIDYMRAHKFSLVWLGWSIPSLTELRRRYIGAERRPDRHGALKSQTGEATVRKISERDPARAAVVRRYFLEMTHSVSEMHRVLSPGRSAIVVVGPSTIRGVVVDTALILAEIGEETGFQLGGLKEREIDRDRRLMPVSHKSSETGIEARMHREHVIAFMKPA